MHSKIDGRVVAITGAAGTIGRELVRQTLAAGAQRVVALDHAETSLFEACSQIDDPRLQGLLCDITSASHLKYFLDGVDYVFHVAAYKHVPLCEMHPGAAVETNILGVQNVIEAARHARVRRVLFTSSDKAVNPTNVMGTSKLMGERLFTAANTFPGSGARTVFASTRFGNVAGSSGSVLSIFARQIRNGGPVTLTDKRMTRFMMTLQESVQLVISSMFRAMGGEVFVMKMPVVRIADVAQVMIEDLAPKYGHDPAAIEIVETGVRPGEKLYEELTTDEELPRTAETGNLFVVLPAFRNIYSDIDFSVHERDGTPARQVYNSSVEPPIAPAEVRSFLRSILSEQDDL